MPAAQYADGLPGVRSSPDYQANSARPDGHADAPPYPIDDDVSDIVALKSLRHSPFSEECLFVVATIIQHESGSFKSSDVWNFMADQITYDAALLGCFNLTRRRWAIKSRPRPIPQVLLAARRWPRVYPKCQFVGMVPDIAVWKSYGYRIRQDYTFTDGMFTVVGINCGTRTPVLLSKVPNRFERDFDN